MLRDGVRFGFYQPGDAQAESSISQKQATGGDEAKSPAPEKPTSKRTVRGAFRWLHERAILDSLLVVSLFVLLLWYSHGVISGG